MMLNYRKEYNEYLKKLRKDREVEYNKMQLDFFSKYEETRNGVEGFEKEVFCYLNKYYADDSYVLSWTHEDLENFIFDFAENYMRWLFKIDFKNLPSNPDFEWIEKIFRDFSKRYEDDESPAKVFKRIDLIRRTEAFEMENNPQKTDESDEDYEARIHNIIAQKCKTIIEDETFQLRKETKEKFKYLKETYPNIFENTEFVGGIYGFPLSASLVALNYRGRSIYVTYTDFMEWNNTEDFEKIILKFRTIETGSKKTVGK